MIGGWGLFPFGGGAPFLNPAFRAQQEGAKLLIAALAVGAILSNSIPRLEGANVDAYVDGKPVRSYVQE